MRDALIVLLLVGGAVWWAWPRDLHTRRAFTAPGVLEVRFPRGEGVAQSLYTADGRLHVTRELTMELTPFVDPVSVTVDELQGAAELRLGPADGAGASLLVTPGGLQLRVRGATEASQTFAGVKARSITLQHDGTAFVAIVDGRPLQPSLPGPAPEAPAALVLKADASLLRLSAGNAGGEVRILEDTQPPPGWDRVAWAAASALLLAGALRGWWRLVVGGRTAGALERITGIACTAGLALGLAFTLARNNAQRLGEAPAPCDDQPFAFPSAVAVSPGTPCEIPGRRDGDFRLTADVTLQPDTAIDVLLRASVESMDQQILLTLSSDADLPSGLSRNHSLFLQTQPAPEESRRLPADRPLKLEVTTEDDTVSASVDGRPLGRISDLDLRAGRTAFQALSGGASFGGVRIEPLHQPRALTGRLRSWELGAAALAVLAVLFMARRCGRGWAAALAIAPLAVVAQPLAAPELHVPGLFVAALLLVLTPARGGRILTLTGGALLIGLTAWAQGEREPLVTPAALNALGPADVAGPPLPARYAWARHPLCRRFNAYLRTQTFRDRHVPLSKAAGSVRIVSLGSSSTFGYGVQAPQCWSHQLELLLRGPQHDRAIEVVNAGVPGATAESLRRHLQGVVLPLQPDIVIISLGFNDHVHGGVCDEREHFARMTTDGIGWWEQLLRQTVATRAGTGLQAFRDAFTKGKPVSDADVRRFETEPAERFASSLRDLVADCRAAGAQVVLVEEPTRPDAGDRTLDAFHAAMAAVGKELGVPVAAPQEALDKAGGALFVDTVHPNAAGHRIVARVLADTLQPLLPDRH